MTSEEKQDLIARVACLEVWPTECEPPLARGINGELVVGNETKFNLFKAVLDKLTDAQWTYDNLLAIVAQLRSLPHDDLPQLKNIRTRADIKRLVNNPQQLKRLAHLRPESPANREINERMQFIRKYDLRGPETTDKVVQNSDASEQYQEIRDRVSKLTSRDCGTSYSAAGQGPWDKVNRCKTELFAFIDDAKKRNTPIEDVTTHVDARIAKLRDSGIQ
jgi:hypothetical protein